MDLRRAIQQLYAEKQKLESVIAALEELQRGSAPGSSLPEAGSGRGRKSMDSEERQRVSERMKRYWANRRKSVAPGSAPPEKS